MGRSQESFNKKEVRKKKAKKRQDKEKKRLAKKDDDKKVEDIEISIPRQDPNDRPDPIRRGRLTFYNDSKGYGFIRDAETQESIFVHVNEFQDDIMEGNMVSFEVEKGMKGPAAVRVKLA